MHTTVTATKESGTLVARLYDGGPLGVGELVGHAPYTCHGQTPGKPFGVNPNLCSIAYDGPAGHRLALIVDSPWSAAPRLALFVDTVDPHYTEHDPSGAQPAFSSPPQDPSYVSVPVPVPLREQGSSAAAEVVIRSPSFPALCHDGRKPPVEEWT